MFDENEFADFVAENDFQDFEAYVDPDKNIILEIFIDILKKLISCDDSRSTGSSFDENLYVMNCLLAWSRVKRGEKTSKNDEWAQASSYFKEYSVDVIKVNKHYEWKSGMNQSLLLDKVRQKYFEKEAKVDAKKLLSSAKSSYLKKNPDVLTQWQADPKLEKVYEDSVLQVIFITIYNKENDI